MKPPESFVPLTAAPVPPVQREFRVSILNPHSHGTSSSSAGGQPSASSGATATARSAGFQSLETARPVSLNLTAGAEKKLGEPRVTVQRDGDRITHLRIQCPCGQIMDLACVYETLSAK